METTHFDLRITKEQAEEILRKGLNVKYGFEVMCKEYAADQADCTCDAHDNNHTPDCDIEAWSGIYRDDLNEDGTLDEEYTTFELWK